MNKLKTIVIHPYDETTNFLQEIYNNNNFHVLRDPDFPKEKISPLIEKYERIILLGHGLPTGLLSGGRLLVDKENAESLRGKAVIGIWCFARQFMYDNNLTAFATNMMVSERKEASGFGISATTEQINFSNRLFAKAVGESLHVSPSQMLNEVLKTYRGDENPVIQFNIQHMIRPVEELKNETIEIMGKRFFTFCRDFRVDSKIYEEFTSAAI